MKMKTVFNNAIRIASGVDLCQRRLGRQPACLYEERNELTE